MRFGLRALAETLAENVAEVDRADRGARHVRQFEHRHAAAAALRQLDLDLLVVEFAGAQFAPERLARRRRGRRADQRVEHPLLGGELGLGLDVLALPLLDQRDADLDEIAHDLLDVAPDIADLGELGRLDLEERRAGELGEAARDLGLAAAGRPDHQDVLGHDLLAHRRDEAQAAPAIAQGDRDGALGVVLPDDVAIEFGNDLARREFSHEVTGSRGRDWRWCRRRSPRRWPSRGARSPPASRSVGSSARAAASA